MGKSMKASNHKTSYNKPILDDRYMSIINYAFILLISVFLIIIPFYRGLYFRENYIPSIIYISGIFVLYILYKLAKKEYNIFNSYLDIAVLLLPVVYLLSFFFSVNAKDAMDAVLKYAAYFMIYKITSDLCRNAVYKKIFEYTIITAMFVMAAASLMTAFGYIDLKGVMMGNRLFGLYQYSNATASAMGAAIFLTLGFSIYSNKIYEKIYCNLVLATVFPVFILTLSRGAYVIFAVLVILNTIMLNARKRIQYIFSMLTLAASNGMFLFKYYGTENVGAFAIYFLGAVIIFLTFQLVYEKLFLKPIEKIGTKAVNTALILTFIAIVTVTAVIFSIKVPAEYKIEHASGEVKSWKNKGLQINEIAPNKEYTVQFSVKSNVESQYSYGIVVESINDTGEQSRIYEYFNTSANDFMLDNHKFTTKIDTKSITLKFYNYEENSYTVYNDIRILDFDGNVVKKFNKFIFLPEVLADRIADINLETKSVSSRAYFLNDGIKIMKDYFLIGTGGGGWKNLYRQYQSLPYDSTEAHNFYLQYALETGIFGIAVILAIYYWLITKAYISLFRDKEYEKLPIYIAILMMMGHAFMDFDLSLTALAFLFWMMIGIAGVKGQESGERLFNNSYIRVGLLISTVAVLYFSSSIYIGMLQGKEAASLIEKDANKSIRLYESAMQKDPYNSNYHMDYIQVMYRSYKSNNDSVSLGKMQKSMDIILQMGIHDTRQSSVLVNLLLSTGELDKAIGVVDDMVNNNPMIADMYMYKINVNYQIAKQFFSNNEQEKAIPYLKSMIEVETQFSDNNERAAEPMKSPEKMDEMIELAREWLEIAEKK